MRIDPFMSSLLNRFFGTRAPHPLRLCICLLVTALIFATRIPAAGEHETAGWDESGTSVSVTPDAGQSNAAGYTDDNHVDFTVELTEGDWGNFSVSCSHSAPPFGGESIMDCTVSEDEILVTGMQNVRVHYDSGEPGSGWVSLHLSPESCSPTPCSGDGGKYDITVSDPPEPVVVSRATDLRLDPGTAASFGAGPASRFRPHELMVHHRLPGHISQGKDRGVTLVYSSQNAAARTVIPFDVTLSSRSPDEFTARLEVDGVQQGNTIHYETLGWDQGETRRLALLLDGSGFSSGSYGYRIVTTAVYDGTGYESSSSGRLAIINETASAFGAGWRVAGVQRLYDDGDTITIVGAMEAHGFDVFVPSGSGYAAPEGDHSTLTSIGSGWKRRMKDGTEHFFDGAGLQDSTVDRNGNRTTYSYDANGRLTAITDPVGWSTTFSYSSGQVEIGIRGGRTATLTLGSGRLTQITDPDGSSLSFGYGGNGRLTSRTSKRGHQTTYGYDYGSLPSSSSLPISASRSFASPRLSGLADYPSEGSSSAPKQAPDTANVEGTYTDARGHTWTFQVEPRSLARSVWKDPTGQQTTWQRRADGQAAERVLPNGRKTQLSYDSKGNLTQRHELYNGAKWKYTYESTYSNLTRFITPTSDTTRLEYDGNGNPNVLILPEDSLWRIDYNSAGQPTRVLLYTLSLTDSSKSYEVADSFYYDAGASENLIREKRIRDFSGTEVDTVGLSYDAAGRLTHVRDHRGGEVVFSYDDMNRVTQRTDQLGRNETWSFNVAGADSVWTNRRGQTVTYSYDALDRLTGKLGTQTAGFEYDDESNLTRAYDNDSDVYFYPDALGRDTTVIQNGKEIGYSYYDGMADRRTMKDPDGGVHTFTVDTLSRLVEIEDPEGRLTTFEYDLSDRRTSMTQGNGVETAYIYDRNSNLTLLEATYGTSTLVSFDYTYDPQGRRTSWTYETGYEYSFTYDLIGQLESAVLKDPFFGSVVESDAYDYDGANNRTAGGEYTGYTYNAANRLTSTDSSSYGYDLDGNLTSETDDGSQYAYSYDREGRLTSQSGPGFSITYKYDALGRRIEQSVDGTVTKFVYDGDHVLMDVNSSGSTVVRYTHGPGIDELVSVRRGGSTYYYVQDALNSVVRVLDQSRSTVNSYEYKAWGEIRSQSEGIANRYTYTGREPNADGRTMHYRAREYLPHLGRFGREDPIGFLSGINLYSYVSNSPCTYIDPSGRIPCGSELLDVGLTLVGGALALKGARAVANVLRSTGKAAYQGGRTAAGVKAAKTATKLDTAIDVAAVVPVAGAFIAGYRLGTCINEAFPDEL